MPDTLEKFTPHLKNVLTRALCAVIESGAEEIETNHLLWAILSETDCIGSDELKSVGLSLEKVSKILGLEASYTGPLTSHAAPAAAPLLSKDGRRALEKAILTASVHEHAEIGTEHLLFGLLHVQSPALLELFQKVPVNPSELLEHTARLVNQTTKNESDKKSSPEKKKSLCPECGEMHDEDEEKSALEFFAIELTSSHHLKTIDDVIGRDEEISRLANILSRKTKNNPLLLGEPGVGKTAIVEGLAKRIASGTAPLSLRNHRLFVVDLPGLVAGTTYRGDFEARLLDLLEEVKAIPEAILFIDELHTLVGAGAAGGTMDAANILKPALARGELRLIGATTYSEYKKHVEPDGALTRRFATINVKEPSLEETKTILRGLAPRYSEHHGITIPEEIVDFTVDIAARAFPTKVFPDKAVDLFDEACAEVGLGSIRRVMRRKTDDYRKKLAAHRARKNEVAKLPGKEEVAKEIERDIVELEKMTNELMQLLDSAKGKVTKEQIVKTAARMSSISAHELLKSHDPRLTSLEKKLSESVFGQEKVIKNVSRALALASLGLKRANRPLATFLFAGPSGVGKTELGKTIAREFFFDEGALIRLDGSEYGEPHSVAKLIGSPPGYVGFRERAKLTESILKKPHSVILFDEAEKAHADVLALFLQVLDDGTLEDAAGVKVDFSHAVIVFTTNAGKDRLEKKTLGFGATDEPLTDKELRELLETHFKSEFLNRIDDLCLFTPLSTETLEKIIAREIIALKERAVRHNINLVPHPKLPETLAKRLRGKTSAREIRRLVEQTIAEPLSAHLTRHPEKLPRTLRLSALGQLEKRAKAKKRS